ncbi:MAG: TetR/AcrR family transcriptional regulator [Opitutae bacterium]
MNSPTHQLFRQQNIGKKKRERTRGALLDSALSVFAAKGYEATRINDITAHAEMANGTFYNYYQDKDQLLHDVALGLLVEIAGRTDQEMAGLSHAPSRVALAAAKLLRTAREEPEWVNVLLQATDIAPEIQSATVQYMKKDLEIGVEQGVFKVAINVLLMNQVISLIKAAALIDPDMSDSTIRSTCEAILRLVGMGHEEASKEVELVFVRYLGG